MLICGTAELDGVMHRGGGVGGGRGGCGRGGGGGGEGGGGGRGVGRVMTVVCALNLYKLW